MKKNTQAAKPAAKAGKGKEMHVLATRLFPICRSITGNGVRETLKILQKHIPLTIHEVPSGTSVLDWTVPKEWNIKDAYITTPRGKKIAQFKKNNLHVVGYSTPINKEMSLAELQEHLYSLPDNPSAIPYVTSYYKERWGFCLTHKERASLREGAYRVFIDSELKKGSLTYGELVIPGKSDKEIFLSTYICHPSMANNELSGPVVTTYLAKWVKELPRHYTYRIVFVPETIGAITYLSRNLAAMKQNIIAGFNISCVGDDRAYSYLPSRRGNTRADRAALAVLERRHPDFVRYTFRDRGSDERQYCAPGADLPVASIMRTRYGSYPEYHTSLDNLKLVTPAGLQGSFDVLRECLELLESTRAYAVTCVGEPQLGKRNLYPTLSRFGSADDNAYLLLDILAYADGDNDPASLSRLLGVSEERIREVAGPLIAAGLIIEC